MKVAATYSIKGGVGKTTAAVNLAFEAAWTGARVLLWDVDPQGAATFFFRVKPSVRGGAERLISSKGALEDHARATDYPGLHLVPADFSMRHLDLHLDDTKRPMRRIGALLEPLNGRYDVAILDCPPGVTLASESVFGAADAVLVPTIPTTLSRRTLDQLVDFLAAHAARPVVLPFASMVDGRKSLHRDVLADLASAPAGLLPTIIPSSTTIERMGVRRAPVGAWAPRSKSAMAFHQLWADVAARLWP